MRGRAGLAEYTEESLEDPQVRDIAQRISIAVDPELQASYPDPRPMVVEIADKMATHTHRALIMPEGTRRTR